MRGIGPLALGGAVVFAVACGRARPPCTAGAVCGAEGSCLDGTCTTAAALPTRAATRIVAKPVALAWIRRGSTTRDAIATLGGSDGKLLLRFSVPIEGVDRLVAAHVVLTRIESDPPLAQGNTGGVVLRPERIVDVWEEDAVTWQNQPRTFDLGLPRVRGYGSRMDRIRLDVREIVRRWPRHDISDQGIAISGEGTPSIDVALTTLAPDVGLGSRPAAGPELELYFSPVVRPGEETAPGPVKR